MINNIKHFLLRIWLWIKGLFTKSNFDNVIFTHYINNVFKQKITKILNSDNMKKLEDYISKIKKLSIFKTLEFDVEVSKLKEKKNIDNFCNYLINKYNEIL